MRARFDIDPPVDAGLPSDRAVARRIAQIATLLYWAPCLGLDSYLLWAWRGEASIFGLVFRDLFLQSLIFLAGWLAIGGVMAILFSRWGAIDPRPSRRGRHGGDGLSAIARDRRGG